MNQNALIWGADGGIGGAFARLLIERDWNVVAVGRHFERMIELRGASVEVDVGDPFSVQRAASAISQEVEEIHLWLYSVGDIYAKPVSQMELADWKRILDANLTGAYLATQATWHLLAKDAHLFYLGALHERLRLPGLSAYAAAKAGVEALAEVVRKESRCKVCVVRPAAVDTPLWKKAPFKLPPHHLKPAELAVRIYQAYQDGAQGSLDV